MIRFFAVALVLVLLFPCDNTFAQVNTPVPTSDRPMASQDVPDWQARLELGDLLSGAGRFGEAEVQYRKVLEQQPENEVARVGLARVLAWTGKGEEAIRLFTALPDSAITSDDRMLIADQAIGLRQYDMAIRQLLTVLKDNPDNDDARLKLAEVYSWSGRLDDSFGQYERLLKRHPEDVQIRRKYAQALSWAGRNEDAIRELKRTLD
ncbi:Tetratricopeptide TPR_1 repeat-containing protein [Pseudodesulfovibrio aespoeensis Aspo-2]|uniref:Tetratricopeptide TPR_1 repeat-containing protein n=2 Tax=Desulfovibrionaceae TaxID=194924 RepID=E6VRT4_PSEA9|nr:MULTISPECIES: tetratricopeptide repeat protein [Pseudodesulfovibrio]ADU64221.1 Tetratricopeptide TPR_1 repeat-containing protein [Pseudodesulfovibrio aespoeensis Aspo-2]